MKKRFIIGVTGVSGAGKTTACEILKGFGCFCLNADEVSKNVLDQSIDCKKKLASYFGLKILDSSGKIKRKELSKIAFLNDENARNLNKITHPYIVKEILNVIDSLDCKFIVLDVPLLFESGLNSICNFVVSIVSEREISLKRVMLRDKLDAKFIKQRFLRQKDNKFFKENADYVIFNNSTKENLYIEVLKFFKSFQEFIDGL